MIFPQWYVQSQHQTRLILIEKKIFYLHFSGGFRISGVLLVGSRGGPWATIRGASITVSIGSLTIWILRLLKVMVIGPGFGATVSLRTIAVGFTWYIVSIIYIIPRTSIPDWTFIYRFISWTVIPVLLLIIASISIAIIAVSFFYRFWGALIPIIVKVPLPRASVPTGTFVEVAVWGFVVITILKGQWRHGIY